MWLLDTHSLKLHYFASPEAVDDGYVILSHVWSTKGSEISFQDIQHIHQWCAASGEDPHDFVNTKVRECCALAERHGYKWAWIDTCCIDKTSSAELMEAINAMYHFYALSLVCYVYLSDTRSGQDSDEIRFHMRNSTDPEYEALVKTRWQKRGWTLQELIAPRVVHFLSNDWEFLGTRNDLADYLEAGLGIPASVLRHQQSPFEFSVAQRMSWAAKRTTTRLEDEAYSLMGLFGISMPILYGEGRKAFQRLQEEILTHTGDTTLFAWGALTPLDGLQDSPGHTQTGLLASAPSDFKSSRNLYIVPPLGSNSALHRRIGFRTTPHGPILAKIPVLHLNGQAFGDLSWHQGDSRLLLVLTRWKCTSQLPYPIYGIGVYNASGTKTPPLRLVKIHEYQDYVLATPTNLRVSLRTILLVRHQPREKPVEPIYLPLNHSFPPSIRLPEYLFQLLLNRPIVTQISIINAQLPWSGDPPLINTFRVQTQADVLYATVLFGLCTSHSTNGKETGALWANFRGGQSGWECTDYKHQCTTDHVLNWPGLKRRFVVQVHANHKGMGDHVAKWIFDMEFTHFIQPETLVLTHITSHHRVLLPGSGYHDFLEDEEAAEQIEQTLAPVDVDSQKSPIATRGKEPETLARTTEVPRSAFSRFFHRLACTYSTELLDGPIKHGIASTFMYYPATSHWSDLGSKDLSLFLP